MDASAFSGNNTIVRYLPWTSGWGATFGGCPTMLCENALPPAILTPPLAQTAEIGSVAFFSVEVTNMPPEGPCYQWYSNGANAIGDAANSLLEAASLQSIQAGAYTVVFR